MHVHGGERVARADREFCSNACRLKAYRRRKEEALRLHAGGKTAAEVSATGRHTSAPTQEEVNPC